MVFKLQHEQPIVLAGCPQGPALCVKVNLGVAPVGATLAPLPGGWSQGLTSSECAVLTLVLGGHSNAEVARVRGTSVRTIANQLAAIYQKLGVGSRRELGARQRSRAGVAK